MRVGSERPECNIKSDTLIHRFQYVWTRGWFKHKSTFPEQTIEKESDRLILTHNTPTLYRRALAAISPLAVMKTLSDCCQILDHQRPLNTFTSHSNSAITGTNVIFIIKHLQPVICPEPYLSFNGSFHTSHDMITDRAPVFNTFVKVMFKDVCMLLFIMSF